MRARAEGWRSCAPLFSAPRFADLGISAYVGTLGNQIAFEHLRPTSAERFAKRQQLWAAIGGAFWVAVQAYVLRGLFLPPG